MKVKADRLWLDALSDLLNRSHLFQPDELAEAVGLAVSRLGLRSTVYLVDDEQRALHPVPQADRPVPVSLDLDGSVPGRVFCLVRSMPVGNGDGWWVPMVNGTDRLGVIEFASAEVVDVHDDLTRQRCEMLAGLVGHLITVTAPKGDSLYQVRRSQPMSTGAELLSHMLPPLTSSCERLAISAILEPCYDVGGDGFDYAIDGPMARMLILDAVGHGLGAGITCTVAMAAIRAARRAGHGLYAQARAVDAALLEQFSDARFATSVLAELNMDTGTLRYINAGHPAPLLLRAGRVIRELPAGRRLPLGMGAPAKLNGIGPNYIDSFIVKVGGTYHDFTKNETTKYIEHATATSLTGPWRFVGTGNWAGWGSGLEGSALVQLPDGSWRIYFDQYTAGRYWYADSSNLTSFSAKTRLPGLSGTVRHFTVLRESVGDRSALPTGNRSLQSANYPTRYVRHRDNLGSVEEVNPSSTVTARRDATFQIVAGLANSACYSIQSVNRPGSYLRHYDFVLTLQQNDGSATFAGDATFCSRTGLAGGAAFSLESYNHPGYYIRHYNFALRLDRFVTGSTFAGDASFTVTPPLA